MPKRKTIVIDPTQLDEQHSQLLRSLILMLKEHQTERCIRLISHPLYSLEDVEIKLTHMLIERKHNEGSPKRCYCFEVLDPAMSPIARGTFGRVVHSLGVLSVDKESIAFNLKLLKRVVKIEVIKQGKNVRRRLKSIHNEHRFSNLSPGLKSKAPSIFKVDSTNGYASYLTMNFVRGMPLNKYIDFHRKQSIDILDEDPQVNLKTLTSRLNIAIAILQNLKTLHDQGCIHHDIKSKNIICANNAETDAVIVDFGFAEHISIECAGKQGTPNYLAPEIHLSAAQFPRTTYQDIYSAGVTLAELFDAHLPICPDVIQSHAMNPGSREFIGLLEDTRFVENDEHNSWVEAFMRKLITEMTLTETPEQRLPLTIAISVLEEIKRFVSDPSDDYFKSLASQALLLDPHDRCGFSDLATELETARNTSP